MVFLNDVTRFQLDAIPTVGFSDPILSYFTAIQFNFHGVRMLNEGYEKVIYPFAMRFPRIKPMTILPLDNTGSIQNRDFLEMDGAGFRTWVDRRYEEGPR
jgi:hypothetical protein